MLNLTAQGKAWDVKAPNEASFEFSIEISTSN